jgi:outer membrane autotransporter protein
MGAFAGYSQMKNGEGLQIHVAAAYQQGDADFSRVNLHGGVNPVMSEADIESYGLGADAGWGIVLKDQQVVTPFVSINFVKSTRDDYREEAVAIDSLSYDSYSAAYTVGELGVRVNGPVAKQINYRLSVGLENVLSGDIETFRLSASTDSGFYDSRAELDGWSLNSSAGLSYMIDESKALTLDGYIRQAEGGLSNSGLSFGYKAGF